MKSDCSGLFGFTASAPATAVRLTGTDILGDAGRGTRYGKNGMYGVQESDVHASKAIIERCSGVVKSDIGGKVRLR